MREFRLILLAIYFLLLSGCGTFGIKNLDRSEAALDFAKKVFSNFDYKKLNEKINLPKSDIIHTGSVQLYSAVNEPFSIEQKEWYYTQRLKRADGIECYAYVHVALNKNSAFEISENIPGKFHCFENVNKFSSVDLF